jgi:hypothetical protein
MLTKRESLREFKVSFRRKNEFVCHGWLEETPVCEDIISRVFAMRPPVALEFPDMLTKREHGTHDLRVIVCENQAWSVH